MRTLVGTNPGHRSSAAGVTGPVHALADTMGLRAPLEFVHALVTQVPDARKHLVRYYGAYSHRFRGRVRTAKKPEVGEKATEAQGGDPSRVTPEEPGSPEARRRSSWAQLLKKVFEVDPLLCPRCGATMWAIAWITDPAVIDKILAHRREKGLDSPFEEHGPPVV